MMYDEPTYGGSSGCQLNTAHTSVLMGANAAELQKGEEGALPYFTRGIVSLGGHEIAHSWDCANRSAPNARWSREGLATFLGGELLRIFRGGTLHANRDIRDPGTEFWAGFPHQGHFTNGYTESSPFLRYVAWTLQERHGVPWGEARAAVIRGSVEGWWGKQSDTGQGMVHRVRQLGDPTWDPVRARLDWVLSTAADDRAQGAATRYRVPALLEVWRMVENKFSGNIWDVYFHRGTLVAGEGSEATGGAFSGSNGYVLIEDPNGIGVALEGEVDVDTVVWKILRFQ